MSMRGGFFVLFLAYRLEQHVQLCDAVVVAAVAAGDEHHVLAVIGKGGGVRPTLAREGIYI